MNDTPQPNVLVRWLDEPSAECLRDDGIHNYDVSDFVTIINVFATDSVENAKLLIQQALIKDELIWDDSGDAPLTDYNQPWRWEPDKEISTWWTLFLNGDVVASACIEPINVLQPDGPT